MSNSNLKGTTSGKETLYVDVDEEITGIIDKVLSSKSKIVALVLPKRSAVMQSVVNMKLLKRSAENSGKSIVLITSEAALLPLAGVVGIHVAKSLQSRPAIPNAPDTADSFEESIDEDSTVDDFDQEINAARPVGELASASSAAVGSPLSAEETIELDDPDEEKLDEFASDAPVGKTKPNKSLKVPNFNKFRTLLFVGGLALIGLIVFGYFAMVVWPKASIAIATNSRDINSRVNLTLSTGAQSLDMEASVVPAKSQQQKKTQTQQVPSTGSKNNGDKATGQVRFYNCNKNDLLEGKDYTVRAGTGISSGGVTYITQEEVIVEPSNYPGGVCAKNKLTGLVKVVSLNAGTQSNKPATNGYTVSGFSTMGANGSEMSGGTDEVVKVVSQADIDSATQKLSASQESSVKPALADALTEAGYTPVDVSFKATEPQTSTSAKVGDQVDTVTVTQTVTYTMLGAKKADLSKLIAESVKDQIDSEDQKLLDDGVNEAAYKLLGGEDPNNIQVSMTTSSRVGPDIAIADVKKTAAGKKGGTVEDELRKVSGVTDVEVTYSPFWVKSVPANEAKITVTIEKAK